MKTTRVRLLRDEYMVTSLSFRIFISCVLLISCVIGAFTLSGCTQKKKPVTSETEVSTVTHVENHGSYYQVENIVLHSLADNEDISIVEMVPCGDHVAILYWLVSTKELPDGILDFTTTLYLSFYDGDGNAISTTDMNPLIGQGNVLDITADASGNIRFLLDKDDSLKIQTLDPMSALVQDPIRLTPTDDFIAVSFELDNTGDAYVYGYGETSASEIIIFDATGKQKKVIEDPALYGDIYRCGSKMYASFFDSYSNQGEFLPLLYEIDAIEGVLKNPISIKFGSMGCGTKDGLYMNSPYGMSYINLEKLQSSDLFLWADINADKRLYGSGALAVISPEVIYVLSNDNDPEKEDEDSVIILRKSTETPNSEKSIISVAGIWEEGYEPYELTDAILAFNTQSEDYRIVSVGYETLQILHLAMLEGMVPDIVIAQQSESLSVFETRGLLLDLYPLMDSDIDFNRNEYFESVFALSENNGHLYKLPTIFSISGLGGLSSQIGEKTGWTVREADQALLARGDVRCFNQGQPMSYLLELCVKNSLSHFIDTETNTCSFETPEFCELLLWSKVNGRPDDKPDQGYEIDYPLLTELDVMNSGTYAMYCTEYNEPFSVIGYPSPTRNSPMCFIYRQLGITTGAENPEICWEFLKMYLSEDIQRITTENYGFPVKRSVFEEQLDVVVHPDKYNTEPDPFSYTDIHLSEGSAQDLRDLIDSLDTIYPFDESVMQIILEEATAYFYDQKSAEDVAELIQDRVQTLVNERDQT